MAFVTGSLFYRNRSSGRLGAIRPETNGCLPVDQSPRLLHARSFRGDRGGGSPFGRNAGGIKRRLHANLQSWHHRGRPLLFCRITRATTRPARDRRFRRTDATRALFLWLDERRDVLVARTTRTKWIYRRISHLQRF